MKDSKQNLLDNIDTPDDLRRLKVEQLPQVCEELRNTIIAELSVNPGHLASSLGVVELTVALHYVFATPEDRLVWDVGHQAYGHKILTGRRKQFATNRKLHGIKPFPSPEESDYDSFVCGHASNSISAALGMAVAATHQLAAGGSGGAATNGSKDAATEGGEDVALSRSGAAAASGLGSNAPATQQPDSPTTRRPDGATTDTASGQAVQRKVVAVIGDGAMSGGLAFEGLNNVSSSPNDLLIILNDNDMSIDRAVGGMEKYLLKLDTNETYNRLRFKASQWFSAKGMLGDDRRKGLIRLNNALKSALSHQQNIFEGMNIRYFGPFDGHDINELVRILRQLKDMKGPKLLHLHTKKGHGYAPAENYKPVWHAPGKFDPKTGEIIKDDARNKPAKFQDVFGHTLLELAEQNRNIVGVTPAMPTGCSMNIMMEAMPDRTFDVGIAEGHAVTFSAGMAKDGLQPFCNIYSAFAQRAYDNIIHDVAILKLPVVLCLDRAGLVGEDGPTHHGAFDLAYLRPIPNLTICSPLNEHELRRLMYTAQLPGKGPFVIRYPRGGGVCLDWHCDFEEVQVGTGCKLRDGNDVAVLSIGPIGNDVAKAIDSLYDEPTGNTAAHIPSVAHYDMRFLKPLDEHILHEVGRKFKKIITVENGVRNGGLGSAVLEWMSDHGYQPRIVRMGLPDDFVEHGTVAELQAIVGLDQESIKREILAPNPAAEQPGYGAVATPTTGAEGRKA